jgi:hypothetical protein
LLLKESYLIKKMRLRVRVGCGYFVVGSSENVKL